MNQERAKLNLKRYKISKIIISIIGLSAYILCAIFGDGKLIISALVFSVLFIKYAPWFFYRKYISYPLSKDLNASLYYEIVKQGKIYVPSAIWQMQSEYFVGNYKNTISICNQKLNEPKNSKKYKYYYLIFLANVYFDLGDDKALSEICKRFEEELSNESKHKVKRIKRQFQRIEFYQNFINQDFDACYSFVFKPQPLPINQVRNIFYKARIALCKDDAEDAEKFFKNVIQKAPTLNYAELSKHGVEAIEKGITYKDTFEELDLCEEFIISVPPKSQRVARIALLAAEIIIIATVVAYSSFSVFLKIKENEQQKQFDKEMAAYKENVRVLVEEQYNGVEILDAFNLMCDNQIVESMFLAKTDAGIVLGSLYTYDGSEKTYYDVKYEMPFSQMEKTTSPLMYLVFNCTTSEYYVETYFYANESELPEDYFYLSRLNIDGKIVYVAITQISSEPIL